MTTTPTTSFRTLRGITMSTAERLCAVLVGLEVSGLGWCVWALFRTYRAVKGHHA